MKTLTRTYVKLFFISTGVTFFSQTKCFSQELAKLYPYSDFIILDSKIPGDEFMKGKVLISNKTIYDIKFKIQVANKSKLDTLVGKHTGLYYLSNQGQVSYYWRLKGSGLVKDTTITIFEKKCYMFAVESTNKSLIFKQCNCP